MVARRAEQCGWDRIDRISLAAPAFNEGEGIRSVVESWSDYLRKSPAVADFEIVVCNDGSGDDTGSILDELASQIPELRPNHLARNQGAAAALATVIAHTTRDWVLLIDSDGQFPLENLENMSAALKQAGGRAAIGVRAKKDTAFARFGTWSSGLFCNRFHRSSYRDFNSAFKLVDGSQLRSLTLEARGLNYSTEISSKLLEKGIELIEVEITHCHRATGKSSRKAIGDAVHRLLFVLYIGIRQYLLRRGVLRWPA